METIQPTMNNNNTPITNDATNIDNADIIIDENFTYDGFQVVRGEFFAHMYEPSITFNNCKVTLNTACIKKLPSVNYVQILVNPKTMKLAVRPCSEDDKDSFLWCTEKAGKRKPKQTDKQQNGVKNKGRCCQINAPQGDSAPQKRNVFISH